MSVRIGILGFGTVGMGVYKLIENRKDYILKYTGKNVEIKKILIRNLEKPREINVKELLTCDIDEILNNKEIELIIEAIGGVDPAYDFVKMAITLGKHVITANKELLAKHGDELFKLAEKRNVYLKYEASVGGAIPIIHQVDRLKVTNNFDFIAGILNGTTNFILSKITENDMNFNEALIEAQKLGFAEANPEYDLKGFDTVYKLAILIRKAFDIKANVFDISRKGIDEISEKDIKDIEKWGYKIKLLGWCKKIDNGVITGVEPVLVGKNNILSHIGGVNNAIILRGDGFGEHIFIGKGAGESPTSDAVVADLIDILLNYNIKESDLKHSFKIYEGSFTDTFYIRLDMGKSEIKNLKDILKFLNKEKVKISYSSFSDDKFSAIIKVNESINKLKDKIQNKQGIKLKTIFKVMENNIKDINQLDYMKVI